MFKKYQKEIQQIINVQALQFDGSFQALQSIAQNIATNDIQIELKSNKTIKKVNFKLNQKPFVINIGDYFMMDQNKVPSVMTQNDFDYQFGNETAQQAAQRQKIIVKVRDLINSQIQVEYQDGIHGPTIELEYHIFDRDWFTRNLLDLNPRPYTENWEKFVNYDQVEAYVKETIKMFLDQTHEVHIDGAKQACEIPTWLWKNNLKK